MKIFSDKKYLIQILILFLFLLGLFLVMPQKGFWGIDAGIKTLTSQQIAENGISHYSIPHPGKSLDSYNRFYPYGPPFVLERNGRQVSVFSPLYQTISAFCYKVTGEQGIRFLSMIGTLLAIIGLPFLLKETNETNRKFDFFSPPSKIEKVSFLQSVGRNLFLLIILLSTPILFYSLVIWEHTLFVAAIVWSLILLESEKTWKIILAGFILSLGVGLRPEGFLFLLGLLIIYRKKVFYFVPGIVVGLIPVLLLQYLGTGSLIPIQWTENLGLGHYDIKGILTNFSVLLGFSDFLSNIPGWAMAIMVVIGLVQIRSKRKFTAISSFAGICLIYLYLIIHRFISPTHPNLLASATGIFGCCPFIAFWWLLKSESDLEKKLKWLLGGILLISIFINPVAVGVHYGPRVLLPVIFISAAFLIFRLPVLKNNIQKYTLVFLIAISVIFQVQSLIHQYQLRRSNAEMRETILENVDSPLLLSFWYHAGDLGPDIANTVALHPGNYAGWQVILKSMRDNGITSFWRLSREFSTPVRNLPVKPTGKEFYGKYWKLTEYTLQR